MRSKRNRLGLFVVIGFAALTGIAGCGDDEEELGDAGVVRLTDGEIGNILIVSNQNELSVAQLAQTHGTQNQVRDYANRVLAEDAAALNRTQTILNGQMIVAADSDESRQLVNQTKALTTQLNAVSGSSFDLTYMCSEIRTHLQLISLIDTRLIPDVQNPVLASELQTERVLEQNQLAQAQLIVQSFAPQGSVPLATPLTDGGLVDTTTEAAVCANFGGIVPLPLPVTGVTTN